MRRRLLVVAPNPVEVVRYAGGWLFDRAIAGWDVRVLTADPANSRPLRILGVRPFHLEPTLASPVRGPRPQAVAVAAELYDADARVRRLVHAALDDGMTDCRLWADRWPTGFAEGADAVRYRMSTAARAFKAQAMAALAAPVDELQTTETFRQAELLHPSTSA
jgi:hypothetical protein